MKPEYCKTLITLRPNAASVALAPSEQGFTLVEVMIAMMLLIVGIFAYMNLQLSAIKVNEANRRFLIAQDAANQEIDTIKTVGYTGLKTNSVLTNSALGYKATFTNLSSTYKFSGVDTSCNAPYAYCVYKGVRVQQVIDGKTYNHNITLKLSMNPNYMTYPSLNQGDMLVYWMSGGTLKSMPITFFVGL